MNGDTPITVTIKELVAVTALLLAGGYAVIDLSLRGVEADVADIRNRLSTTHSEAKAVEGKGIEADTEIRATLASIDSNGKVVAAELASLKKSMESKLGKVESGVADLNVQMGKLTDQNAEINVRLARIEERLPQPQPQQ
jgi:chromosome segregation ATPase